MDDIFLTDTVGHATIFVSPLSHKMYRLAGGQGLGGSNGYFVCQENSDHAGAGFEILAKANTVEAAEMIFWALISNLKSTQVKLSG